MGWYKQRRGLNLERVEIGARAKFDCREDTELTMDQYVCKNIRKA